MSLSCTVSETLSSYFPKLRTYVNAQCMIGLGIMITLIVENSAHYATVQ